MKPPVWHRVEPLPLIMACGLLAKPELFVVLTVNNADNRSYILKSWSNKFVESMRPLVLRKNSKVPV
jgi:hypothetical protein